MLFASLSVWAALHSREEFLRLRAKCKFAQASGPEWSMLQRHGSYNASHDDPIDVGSWCHFGNTSWLALGPPPASLLPSAQMYEYREQLGRRARSIGTVVLLPGLHPFVFQTEPPSDTVIPSPKTNAGANASSTTKCRCRS